MKDWEFSEKKDGDVVTMDFVAGPLVKDCLDAMYQRTWGADRPRIVKADINMLTITLERKER